MSWRSRRFLVRNTSKRSIDVVLEPQGDIRPLAADGKVAVSFASPDDEDLEIEVQPDKVILWPKRQGTLDWE